MTTTKTVYLSNPSVTIGGVDVTQNTSAASLEVGFDSLESTTFGDSGHRFVSGLQMVNVTLTMFQNYGAGEIEATLYDQVGDGTTTLIIAPAAGAESASNPIYTISNAMLASFTPIVTTVSEAEPSQRVLHWRHLGSRHHAVINN
jgi:hypothetical protein